MAIVIGFDIHREQVTFDALDDVTGEVQRGRIAPADRSALRRFLASLPAGQVDVALEANDGLAVHRRGAGRGRCDGAFG
jgi:transposase